MNNKTILCIAPHPDDEVLGCGGSLIKARKKNYELYLCYLSYGEEGSPKYSSQKLKKIRKGESLMVSKKLGVKTSNVFFIGIGDNQINHNDFDNFKKLLSIIRRVKPGVVFIPDSKDPYNDHREASLLAKRCLDMAGSNNFLQEKEAPWWVDNVLEYEVSSPLSDYQNAVDISKEIEEKINLLTLYKSQTKKKGNISDLVSDKARYLSGYRAAFSVGEFREVFKVYRVKEIL